VAHLRADIDGSRPGDKVAAIYYALQQATAARADRTPTHGCEATREAAIAELRELAAGAGQPLAKPMTKLGMPSGR
jgi:hypothetical protein